ncbi:hypothetical protein CAPTEDRAFT_200909 [Capitella teleta]|uniref:C2H2-type domain-containing protein n=1 Tax=Capitella teleta TaxID=283909 RepID=R7UEM2_CAPTE|nr:hypothetical protein CAPTEDRAFT_200909 [Capitella teleta]|eukprot:ELU01727.1 hypothetical protein CAPTEDRAFT_200909 [Capitella teleta]
MTVNKLGTRMDTENITLLHPIHDCHDIDKVIVTRSRQAVYIMLLNNLNTKQMINFMCVMFSLVTALVSPHVIDVLQAKKDTLVSTLQDNAHVLCLQPSSHVCMLQGEWENVKKAYAILEELYFRVQAERAVGERLKGEPPRFWPPFNEDGERPKRHHVYVYPQSAATREEEDKREEEDEEPEEEEPERQPPVMDAYHYREQNADAISLSSDNNDGVQRDANSSDAPPTLVPVRPSQAPTDLEVISDDSREPTEGRYSPLGSPKPPGMVNIPGCASELSKLTQSYLSNLSSLPQLSPQTKEALSPVPLPPASFLLQGQQGPSGSTTPGFFNYSALYSHHLSALQGMKSEPENTESNSESQSQGVEMKQEPNNYENRELPELKCSHCDKTYRSEARMKEHVKTHDKNYIPVFHSCPKCGKSFTYRHNMIVHLRRFHFGWQPAKRHVCRLCGMRFQKPYMLRDHEQRAHLKAPEETTHGYRCTQCDAIFDNKHALAGHCSKNHNVHIDSAMMAEQDDYKPRSPGSPTQDE